LHASPALLPCEALSPVHRLVVSLRHYPKDVLSYLVLLSELLVSGRVFAEQLMGLHSTKPQLAIWQVVSVAVNSISSSLSSGDLMPAETWPRIYYSSAPPRMPTVQLQLLCVRPLESMSDRSNQKFRLCCACEGKRYSAQRPLLASFRGEVSTLCRFYAD
jgi:hypothetical protein